MPQHIELFNLAATTPTGGAAHGAAMAHGSAYAGATIRRGIDLSAGFDLKGSACPPIWRTT
jgi:hypothetical protein